MFKPDSPVCQIRVYNFDNFNSAASLLNFQEQLFTSLSDIKRLSPFPLTCVDLPGASKHRVKVLTEIPYWCGQCRNLRVSIRSLEALWWCFLASLGEPLGV
jgi:hypothetical protein